MPIATEHLHRLADGIGPRPATTDAEAEAADYIEDVFRAHDVDVERQEFDSPRTRSWAFVLYHLLTIGAAVASGWPFLVWPALAVAAVSAFLLWMDVDTRFGFSEWLPPKGPSQNIIARHTPRVRRGERPTRVVIVAHYDSAKASLAFSPSMAKNYSTMNSLMKWATFAVPVLIAIGALPFFADQGVPWAWYLTIAASAYLVVPIVINVHREVAMDFTDGANGNASGVSVLFDVLQRIVPLDESLGTGAFPRVRQGASAAREAGIVPEGTDIEYVDETDEVDLTALPDDFRWAETPGGGPEPHEPAQGILSLDTVEFEPVAPPAGRQRSTYPPGDEPASPPAEQTGRAEGAEPYDFDEPERGLDEPEPAPRGSRLRGLFGRGKKRTERDEGLGGWLGVGKGFDAREEGRKIGSWENLSEDDDDEFGFKGGRAGEDPLGDPDYAAAEASRIRRRVTESVDRALADKEIWFVATGAGDVGSGGMKALLAAYPDELRRALIINLDTLGSGTLHLITEEGTSRSYRSDRRLLSAGKRIAVESDLPVRTRSYRGPATDATVALARGRRAVSLMAFDVNGRLPHRYWHTDTVENVSEENLKNAARFVTEFVRAL